MRGRTILKLCAVIASLVIVMPVLAVSPLVEQPDMKAIELEDGSEGIMLKLGRALIVKRAGDTCGDVDISIMAELANGTIAEGMGGTVNLKNPEKGC